MAQFGPVGVDVVRGHIVSPWRRTPVLTYLRRPWAGAHNSGDYRSFLRRDVEVVPHDMRIGQRFDQVSWLGRREAFGRPALPRGRAGGVTPGNERVLWRPTRSFAPACQHPRGGPAEAPDR